jgi:hypothetical protein
MYYRGVFIRKCIVNAHIFKEPFKVAVEEVFHHCKVEAGVNENGPDVRFNHIGETLIALVERACYSLRMSGGSLP